MKISILASLLVMANSRIGEIDNRATYGCATKGCSSVCDFIPENENDIIMNPDVFEGDIAAYYEDIKLMYSPELAEEMYKDGKLAGGIRDDIRLLDIKHTGMSRWTKRATNGKVEIPYKLNEGGFTSSHQNTIRSSMDMIEKSGVVQFVPWVDGDTDYLWIYGESTGGCWSYIGRTGGWQTVHLQTNGCVYVGIVAHELMHALGFWHEHTRADRDEYVIINEDRISPGTSNNFNKRTVAEADDLGFSYDYGSVMHYRKTAFSTGGNTIDTIDEDGKITNQVVGQRNGPSAVDIRQITFLYMCPNYVRKSVPDGKYFCNNDCPCWEGKGDCDSDSQCQGDLVCEYGNNDNEVCRKPTERCSVAKPCPEGLEGCTTDNDCIGDSVCNNNVCTAAPTPAPTPAPTLRPHRGWKKRRPSYQQSFSI